MLMKYCFTLGLFVALFLFPAGGCAKVQDNFWDRPPHSDGSYGYDEGLPNLLNIKGLAYHDARPKIIAAGWQPLQTFQEGTEEYKQGVTAGEGQLFWNKGYHELQTCTGGGPSYCAFLFQNKSGDRLRVVAKGEEWVPAGSFARVAGCRFNP